MLSRIGEFFEVSRLPGGVRALRTGRPRSLASFKMVSDLQRSGLNFKTVIDGGANVGQFARACSQVFKEARILSFEPLPDVASKLKENLRDLGNHQVFQTALGEEDGQVEFNQNEYSQSSSVLDVDDETDLLLAQKRRVNKVTVPLSRLDASLQGVELLPKVLLKLDLQGYELPALRGATQTLKSCSHLLIETVFQRAYQGEALFDEIQSFLLTAGFRFHRPLNFVRSSAGQIVQMDALFERHKME